KNSALTSTGLVPFMERFSNSTREVAQDGRRGALMLSVSINHPDAEDFIDAKLEQGKITGANVSVRIDNSFMQAVKNNQMSVPEHPILSVDHTLTKEINVTGRWQKSVHNARSWAEGGSLFWDTIIQEALPDCYAALGYKSLTANPGSEIPLCAYVSWRLLA